MPRFRLGLIPRALLAYGLATAMFVVPAGASPEKPPSKPAPTVDKTTPAKADIHHPPVPVQFDQKMVTIAKKAPITHKPLRPIDPKTKKEVDGTKQLTLPNGKKISVSSYFAELNKLEKKLNEHGHSLNHKARKVALAQSNLKQAELDQKAKAIAAKHMAIDAKSMKAHVKRDEQEKAFKAAQTKDKARLEALRKYLSPGTVKPRWPIDPTKGKASAGTAKKWHWELGDRKLVSAYLEAMLETKGTKEAVSLLGEAEAGSYLVNNKITLLKATGSVRAPFEKPSQARVSVSVLGQTLYNKDSQARAKPSKPKQALKGSEKSGSEFSKSGQFSKTIDKSVSFLLSLGPIPMSVKVGTHGTVGARYFVGVRPLSASAQFVPFASTNVYAQAGVDILVASAGVGGKLRLLDGEVRIGGELIVQVDPSKGAYLEEHAYLWSKMSALSSSLFVYAEVYVPAFDIPPWEKKPYHWDLWKWKGYEKAGYLVNIKRKQNLL